MSDDQAFNPFKREKPTPKPEAPPPKEDEAPYRPRRENDPTRKRERGSNSPVATVPVASDLKASLLAAVGAADLALATVNEIVAALRERAEEARMDAGARVEEGRTRLSKLGEELPTQVDEIRGRLNSDELRKAAEGYAEAATTTYNKLVERGEEALARLRSQPALEEAANRVESVTDQAVELTQDALGTVASQTRAVGERAAKLVGVELPKKAEKGAAPVKKAAAKAPVKKAPAKKAAAKKATTHRK
ncbi:heparin binding hemagglutinin HbhA [Mycobacterium sp. AZCC_0083]|nr:heparin binding hemagglutinin HbhA [Mycobacterium sp. AZCC_0083]